MAKFYGKVGYGIQVEKARGVWVDDIKEISYFGDVLKNARSLKSSDKINDDLSVTNSISIMADPYALNHFFAIRYVEWEGTLWKVSEVTVQRPRLLLRLGEVYDGPTPSAPGSS